MNELSFSPLPGIVLGGKTTASVSRFLLTYFVCSPHNCHLQYLLASFCFSFQCTSPYHQHPPRTASGAMWADRLPLHAVSGSMGKCGWKINYSHVFTLSYSGPPIAGIILWVYLVDCLFRQAWKLFQLTVTYSFISVIHLFAVKINCYCYLAEDQD